APPARGVPRDQVDPHRRRRPARPDDLPGVRGGVPRPRRRDRDPGALPHRTVPLPREPDREFRYLVDPAEPAHPGSVRRERGLPGSPPARGAAPAEPALAPECRHHFGIGHLREVLVPPADRAELPARDNGDELIHGRLRPPVGGRDGSGEDDPVGSAGAGDLARGDRARAGGDPVVNDDDHPAPQLHRCPPASVHRGSALEFLAFTRFDRGDLLLAHPQGTHGAIVHHPHPFPDRTEGELLAPGRAEFAYDEHIQRGAKHIGDLAGDRHASAGEADHDGSLRREVGELAAQLRSGVTTIAKHPHPQNRAGVLPGYAHVGDWYGEEPAIGRGTMSHEAQQRTHTAAIGLTFEEWNAWRGAAREAGYEHTSAWVREAVAAAMTDPKRELARELANIGGQLGALTDALTSQPGSEMQRAALAGTDRAAGELAELAQAVIDRW